MSVRSLQPTRWLAQRLGLSVSTIERLRARGDRNLPPHVVIGPQSIRYDEAVVEAWLAARMQGQLTETPRHAGDEVASGAGSPASSSPVLTLRKRFNTSRVAGGAAGSV